MKKFLVLLIVPTLFIIGCGGTPAPQGPAQVANACLVGAPDWVLNGYAEGSLSAAGSAKMSKAGLSFTRTAAQANARDEMARTMEIKVNNMLKDFTQSTGIGDDEVVDRVTSSTSKQIASQTLTGVQQKAMWQSPCDDLWVLMAMDENIAKKTVKNSVSSSYKNENALWQQFQAANSQRELDEAIEKNFSTK